MFCVWDRVSDLFCVWDRVSDPVVRVEDPQPHHHRHHQPHYHSYLQELSILNKLQRAHNSSYCLVWSRTSDLFVCGTGSPTFLCVGPGLRPGHAGRRPAATPSSISHTIIATSRSCPS